MTKQSFIKAVALAVQTIAPEFGIKVYSPIIAQSCLESAWGTSYKASFNNFFGLKYREGRVTCFSGLFEDSSKEQNKDGSYVDIVDKWYKFATLEDGIRGYFEFISVERYSNLKWVVNPYEYLKLIKEDGYATSLNYVDNVYNIIKTYNLEVYDSNGGVSSLKYNDSNKPLVCMQTNSRCYKLTRKMTIKGILFHSTGANNPNLKRYVQPTEGVDNYDELIALLGKNTNGNDWNHISRDAGLNAWIGKLADGTVTTVQTMPWDFRPWGCGSGSKGSCNDGWIQFEICEDDLSDEDYFNQVYNEAIELTAYLCKLHSLDPNGKVTVSGVDIPVLTCHADSCKLGFGSNHGDINHWFPKYGKSMETVRADVANLLSSGVESKPVEESKPADKDEVATNTMYYVQAGAFSVKANADNRIKLLKSKGFDAILKKSGSLYIVQTGAFKVKANAEALMNKVIASGVEACISTNAGTSVESSSTTAKPTKTIEQLAKEVWAGKWGNGETRKKKLTEAGYDYNAVQKMVNKLYG